MLTPLETVDLAIDSTKKLRNALTQYQSTQVTSSDEQLAIKAFVYTWVNSLRPHLNRAAVGSLLEPINKKYEELLEFSSRSTKRDKYKTSLKALKSELVRLRSQIVSLTTSGQLMNQSRPEFSILIPNTGLRSIVDRRWDETLYCVEGAPLAATVMIGALLEALLFARIEREANKSAIFKLQSTPLDKTTGRPKELSQWTLSNYIDVCFEMGWISRPVKDISGVLREYRNLIHPREEFKQAIPLRIDDAKMYWAVFASMANQIVASIH